MPIGVYKRTKEHLKKMREYSPFQKGHKLLIGFHKPSQGYQKCHKSYQLGWCKGKHWKINDTSKMGKFWKNKKRLPFSKETREKMRISQINRYNKIGRKKHKRYIHLCNTPEYIKWRSEVFERDHYTCRHCGVSGVYLEAHHIKSWAKFPELRYDIINGLTLCKNCHEKTDNYKGKK